MLGFPERLPGAPFAVQFPEVGQRVVSTSLTEELQSTLTLILAGGQGKRLEPLTLSRAKPAVPFGGAYRIIDFTLSNCIHSGLRQIHLLTQYQARSLEEHVRFGWNFLPRRLGQFITVRPPHHGGEEKWYQGTADAIFQNIDTLESDLPNQVLILSGDHIYKMDYRKMLREHLEHDAALTIGTVKIPVDESPRFGIFETDRGGQVLSFEEKPAHGKELPDEPGMCLGSMGIYLFKTEELIRRLREDANLGAESSHDFGKDIIPRMVGESRVIAHAFENQNGAGLPYWRDVGTIDAYYDANLDLCNVAPQFNLYDTEWPTYTLWHNDPPAKTVFDGEDGRRAEVVDSLLCPGVVVSGAKVRKSICSNRCYLEEDSEVEGSILFSGVEVGKGAKLKKTIVDKWIRIPEGETIGHDLEKDKKRFRVTESGIVVVPAGYRF